jgi:hypothetical protein
MEAKWNLCVLRPHSLRIFSFPSHDQAFLAAYDLVGDRLEFSIENPQGIRIEQQEIIEWCHNRFEEMRKAASQEQPARRMRRSCADRLRRLSCARLMAA